IADMTEKITDTNSATEMAEKQLNTFKGSSELLKSELEELSITIGNMLIPILRKLISGNVISVVEKFNALSDNAKELAVKIGVIAAAIGPLLIVLSKVIKLVCLEQINF
ncbi:MAG: phage tail tape measure protein, partial [Clostridia bacterium]|nr:phage tail tape measure protein [Clostridia bacterium]